MVAPRQLAIGPLDFGGPRIGRYAENVIVVAHMAVAAIAEQVPPAGTIVAMKECPLCGESMRLSVREIEDRVPGVPQPARRVVREWICPECDYFEEAEAGFGLLDEGFGIP